MSKSDNGAAGYQPANEVVADATTGDRMRIDRYLTTPLTVDRKWTTLSGVILTVRSSGGTTYRMRAVDDDDERLLLEKRDGPNWKRHLRVHADLERDERAD